MNKLYTFTVTGQGRFPMDMLRYDCAYPAGSGDGIEIAYTLDRSIRLDNDGNVRLPQWHTVQLKSHKEPTPARWASFGWIVDTMESRKL
jgi:hypothetical protein